MGRKSVAPQASQPPPPKKHQDNVRYLSFGLNVGDMFVLTQDLDPILKAKSTLVLLEKSLKFGHWVALTARGLKLLAIQDLLDKRKLLRVRV